MAKKGRQKFCGGPRYRDKICRVVRESEKVENRCSNVFSAFGASGSKVEHRYQVSQNTL